MMRVGFEFVRDKFHQTVLDLPNRFTRREPSAICNAEHVRVDCNRRFAERRIHHDIRRFTADSRQCLERRTIARHFAAMTFDQQFAHPNDIARFGIEQADMPDVRDETFFAERKNGLRRISPREKLLSCKIYADVGCLCRKNDGYEQLEHGYVVEFRRWLWHRVAQPRKNLLALGRVHAGSSADLHSGCCPRIRREQKDLLAARTGRENHAL